MQLLVKLIKKSVYGEQTRKDIEERFACQAECWMPTEYDERDKDYWKISEGNYIVKKVDDQRLEDDDKVKNCNICSKIILCDDCDKLVTETKEFSANLNELN